MKASEQLYKYWRQNYYGAWGYSESIKVEYRNEKNIQQIRLLLKEVCNEFAIALTSFKFETDYESRASYVISKPLMRLLLQYETV